MIRSFRNSWARSDSAARRPSRSSAASVAGEAAAGGEAVSLEAGLEVASTSSPGSKRVTAAPSELREAGASASRLALPLPTEWRGHERSR